MSEGWKDSDGKTGRMDRRQTGMIEKSVQRLDRRPETEPKIEIKMATTQDTGDRMTVETVTKMDGRQRQRTTTMIAGRGQAMETMTTTETEMATMMETSTAD